MGRRAGGAGIRIPRCLVCGRVPDVGISGAPSAPRRSELGPNSSNADGAIGFLRVLWARSISHGPLGDLRDAIWAFRVARIGMFPIPMTT